MKLEENAESSTVTHVHKFELPQVVNATLTPLATAIGETLSTGWKGITMGIDIWYGKKAIDRDRNLKKYQEQIQKELSAISEENLQEPKMSILGPSLEASKYFFEEDWYREMFAKLIAGSCDQSKNMKIHPYFVEAIKQMSSHDAKVLSIFKIRKLAALPIANYRYKYNENHGATDWITHVFLDNQSTKPDEHSCSITNLIRLGFVDVNYNVHFVDDMHYNLFKSNPFYLAKKAEVQSQRKNAQFYVEDIIIKKGIVQLTPLGKDFLDICF